MGEVGVKRDVRREERWGSRSGRMEERAVGALWGCQSHQYEYWRGASGWRVG